VASVWNLPQLGSLSLDESVAKGADLLDAALQTEVA
jgi:hypothetical protein